MNTLFRQNTPRRWRLLFAALAVVFALYGTVSPISAGRAWAEQTAAGAGTRTAVAEVASPLTGVSQAPALQTSDQGPIPGSPVVSTGRTRYFPQTSHFLRGVFLLFWESHGGLSVLGLPITEPIIEDGLTVQYLERARLEWHPDISSDPKQQVLLTRLGAITTEQRGLSFERVASGSNTPSSYFFSETGHNLSNAFLTYWQRNGGLAVFGYPISEEIVETNAADGRSYTVQYFERNRFEWHPENPQTSNVQLGLLGLEYARAEGLSPLARILLPSYATDNEDFSDSPLLSDYVDSSLIPALKLLGHTPQFKWVPALIVQNKIYVEFANVGEQGVAGAFVATSSRTRPYVIVVPESQRNASPEALGSVLAHESTHANDVISGVIGARSNCSVEEELRAYLNGLGSWFVLKGTNALAQKYPTGSLDSIISRSLREFNNGSTTLSVDFNLQAGRALLLDLYGATCSK